MSTPGIGKVPQVGHVANSPSPAAVPEVPARIEVQHLNFYYGARQALFDISLHLTTNRISALIGTSGCGKSTFLRTLNRMYETQRHTRLAAQIRLDGKNILALDLALLRRGVGMVCKKPNPFRRSLFEHVAYAPGINGYEGKLSDAVEQSLRRAALWDEVKDQLHKSAHALSGGQQQRICIARALAVNPEVLLLDEPCSALDPVSTAKIEELLFELKETCTIVMVTHNMQQAARVSEFTAFLLDGHMIEYNPTSVLFTTPSDARTEAYITGRFG